MATAAFCYPNRCSAHATISSQNMPTAHAKGPSGCLRRLWRITTAVPHIAKTRISAKPTKLQKRTGLFSPLHIPNRRPRERPHRRPLNPIRPHVCVEMVARSGELISTPSTAPHRVTTRPAKCAHLGASAQGRLRGPGDRHHAARPGDSESQEAAQRNLHEAYRPAVAEDRRRAGARLFYDGRDGQGFRLSRQGNR